MNSGIMLAPFPEPKMTPRYLDFVLLSKNLSLYATPSSCILFKRHERRPYTPFIFLLVTVNILCLSPHYVSA